MQPTQPVTILLVEDDPGHARLIEKSLRRAHISNEIVTIPDGQDAVDYLVRAHHNADGDLGGLFLILLDVSLPSLDGFQVLEQVKTTECTQHIPVIMLTAIALPDHIERCFALGGSAYLTKPVVSEEFTTAMRRAGLCLTRSRIPTGQKPALTVYGTAGLVSSCEAGQVAKNQSDTARSICGMTRA